MAIDIMTRDTQIPIIVGDKADVRHYERCSVEKTGDEFSVVLYGSVDPAEDLEEIRFPVTKDAGFSLMKNEFALLVALTPDDAIDHAFLIPVNDRLSDVRHMEEIEIKQIAEALVAGDFRLDFIR